jgi:hypothetical protein
LINIEIQKKIVGVKRRKRDDDVVVRKYVVAKT